VTKLAQTGRIIGFPRTNPRRTAVLAILTFAFFLHLPVQAADFKGCNACHKEILEEVFLTYLHVPFMQQRCGECHDENAVAAPREKSDSAGMEARRKIQWLGESITAGTRHVFVVPGERVEETLVVEVQGSKGESSRQEITVPPLKKLAEVKDSGKPPVISEVRLLKVERGVFLSATIGWQTDTLTDALVRYGQKELSQTAKSGNSLGRQHEVVLYNLAPDKTYRFSVVSKDLFGRNQASDVATFSTSRPFAASPPGKLEISLKGEEEVKFSSHFQRIGTGYLLELILEEPAAVYIGSGKVAPKPQSSAGITAAMGDDANFHLGLSSKKVAVLAACRNCHPGPATATHPVNVLPKPGMIIPPQYPTLPDGRITCRSCHQPHGSENEYLAVVEGKRELCTGCHLDML
jgi:predicted CXXCH cytochrome family protein